jgi:hypothetical protein
MKNIQKFSNFASQSFRPQAFKLCEAKTEVNNYDTGF